MKRLDGQWALVTGSSRGIGQQIACGLAQRGCHLVLHGREAAHCDQTQSMLEPFGVQTLAVGGNLKHADGIDAIVRCVQSGPGSIDILYNNAGFQNVWKPLWEISQSEWLESFQVNFFAMVALCNTFVPGMIERGYGRVINLSSGIRDVPQLAPYSATKAAVDKYTADLAFELHETHVLANALDPGWLKTDLGGPKADHDVETVLPGALVPALLDDDGPSGRCYCAQDYAMLEG